MPEPAIPKRFLFVAASTLLSLSLLELGVRLARVEPWLTRLEGPQPLFDPILADTVGGKPLSQYSLPTERAGRQLTRVERITIADPVLICRLKPDAIWEKQGWSVVTNSLGYRDAEWPAEKPVNEVRILCLGDSVTFGWDLEEPDRFTNLLEAALQSASMRSRFRVMNAGVYGYTTTQGLPLLAEGPLLALQPDVALVTFGLNDATGMGRALTDLLARNHRRLPNALDRFATYRCLRLVLVPMRDRLLMQHSRDVSRELYRSNLEKILDLLEHNGIAPVLVGEVVVEGQGAERLGELPAYVRLASRIASERGLPFVDLAAAFSRHVKVRSVEGEAGGAENTRDYFFDSCHPTAKGSRIVAGAIARKLAQTVLAGKVRAPKEPAP